LFKVEEEDTYMYMWWRNKKAESKADRYGKREGRKYREETERVLQVKKTT